MKAIRKMSKVVLQGGLIFLFVFTSVGNAVAQVVTLISDAPELTNPGAITTDGVKLYVGNGNDILSVPIGGGAATTLYTDATPCCVAGLTRIGTDLFWIDPNGDPDATAIFRGSTAGGAITKIYSGFATGEPIVDGVGITTDGTKLYTADEVLGRVHSMNPNGTAITQLNGNRYGGFFDREHFNSIGQRDGVLYIADQGQPSFGDTPPRVQSIPVTGGAFTNLFVGPVGTSRPWGGIAIGTDAIFLTEGNKILQMPITGGTPTELVSDPQFMSLQGIMFFNNALYVTDNGNFDTTDGPGKIYKVSFIDHYKCYKAIVKAGTPRFERQEVTLEDQFEQKETKVLKAVTICNPVSKNGEEIIDSTAHLTCYQIKDASGQDKFSPRDVVVNNQFGELTLTAIKAETLCVPSSKTVP